MDAVFERLAPLYAFLVCLAALLPAARFRALAGTGLALLGLAAAADQVGGAAGGSRFATINELLALAGALVVLAALLLAWRDRRPVSRPPSPGGPGPAGPAAFDSLLLSGLAVAALAPHLILLGLGAVLTLIAAGRTILRAGSRAAWIPLLAGAAALGVALGLVLIIRGPLGGVLANLADGPFSLAAERLLALLLGSACLLFSGLPPLHRVPWRRSLAPLAALLLFRVIAAAFPAGLLTWQMPAMLLLAGGLAWSAAFGRWAQAAVAAGLMALWSGAGGIGLPAGVLVAWGWIVETVAAAATRRGVTLRARWAGLVALPAGLAALPALAASLRAQVLLSVLAVAACAAGLALQWKRRTRAVRTPLY